MLDKTFGLVQLNLLNDPISKVAYIHLQHPDSVPGKDGRRSVRTGEVVLDYDAEGRLHGIEFLDIAQVPKLVPLPQESINSTLLDLCRVVSIMEHALDIETLRSYHDFSFMDPPSAHDKNAADDLWECMMCVEKFWERADTILKKNKKTEDT